MIGSRPEGEGLTFTIHTGAALDEAQRRARALHTWREAVLLVRLRWDTFLEADRASRPGAFAAYVAALEAAAAAAGELADAGSDVAEAA